MRISSLQTHETFNHESLLLNFFVLRCSFYFSCFSWRRLLFGLARLASPRSAHIACCRRAWREIFKLFISIEIPSLLHIPEHRVSLLTFLVEFFHKRAIWTIYWRCLMPSNSVSCALVSARLPNFRSFSSSPPWLNWTPAAIAFQLKHLHLKIHVTARDDLEWLSSLQSIAVWKKHQFMHMTAQRMFLINIAISAVKQVDQ